MTLYARWVAGGAGLLVTENAVVDRRQVVEAYNIVVDDRADLEGVSRWAEAAPACEPMSGCEDDLIGEARLHD